jgi:hypothetical protein
LPIPDELFVVHGLTLELSGGEAVRLERNVRRRGGHW